jgi:hypothetical protein
VLCFAVTFLVYVAFIPHFLLYSSPPTGDQPFYLMDMASLVQDGDLNVKNNYDQQDEAKFYELAPHPPGFVGMSAPRPLGRQLADTPARPPTEEYSAHLPGLAVLLAPAWAIGAAFALWWPATIVAMCAIGALVAVNIYLLAFEMSGRLWIAGAVWLALAFSSPLMTYSYLIFTELTTGLLLIYALRRLALGWAANGPGRRLLVGACIGYTPWLAERCVLIAVPLGLYAAVQWWRYWRPLAREGGAWRVQAGRLAAGLRSAAWLVAPVLVAAGLLLAYDVFRFGTLLPSGTSHAKGQTEVFYWPWAGGDNLTHFVSNSFGLLFDMQWGMLIYAPVYVLAGVGIVAMLRGGRPADRRLLWAMLACSAPYLLLIMAYLGWNGVWCPPSRYQATFVPLLAAPLGLSLYACRGILYKLLYAVLALPGFAFMAIMLRDPVRMWPFGDGRVFWGGVFDWLAVAPESPVKIDLRHVLPSFMAPDEINHPVSTAWLMGGAFAIILLGALLLRRPAAPAIPRRLPAGATYGLAWLGAGALLGLGWLTINTAYLQPKTLLLEQHRWPLTVPLVEAHGLAYLDGKLYIAYLGPRSDQGVLQPGVGGLGALDLTSGAFTPVQPISARGVLTYSYPGDVQTRDDGLLYLLNNGPGDQALYVMRPDGPVVRQLALDGKGTLSLGFGFGPHGTIYATDMGSIHVFAPGGGPSQATWGGVTGGFNNITGVSVDPTGRVYAAESSARRVQVLDAGGRYLSEYNVGCQAWQMKRAGDWLDVVCEIGVRSINWRTNHWQMGRVGDHDPPPGSPTALTYGPDGTLSVLDRDAVVAYKVTH